MGTPGRPVLVLPPSLLEEEMGGLVPPPTSFALHGARRGVRNRMVVTVPKGNGVSRTRIRVANPHPSGAPPQSAQVLSLAGNRKMTGNLGGVFSVLPDGSSGFIIEGEDIPEEEFSLQLEY